MKSAPLHQNEAERLNALHATHLLDTSPEEDFDNLTALAAKICDVPIALISLVDQDRQWFKSKQGLEQKETPREIALCAYVLLEKDYLQINNIQDDPRFQDNPLVTGEPHIKFYCGIPINAPMSELPIGTLCVMDSKPRSLSQDQIDALKILKNQIEKLLLLRKHVTRLSESEARLSVIYQRQDHILESAGLGTWDWDLETNEIHHDLRWYKMLGLKSQDGFDRLEKWESLVHPQDQLGAVQSLHRYLDKKSDHYEHVFRMKHANGKWIWILDRGRVSEWTDDGKAKRLTGTHFDISHYKNVDLLANEIQTMARIGAWEISGETQILSCTDQVLRIHGLPRSQGTLKIVQYLDLFSAEDREALKNSIDQGFRGVPLRGQYSFTDSYGTRKWIELMGLPVHDSKNEVLGLRGTIQDVTEQHLAQMESQKKDAIIQSIFLQSQDAFMTSAPPTWKFTSCNPATLALFEFSSEEEFVLLGPWHVSPLTQSDGEVSSEKAQKMINQAIASGHHSFEWDHITKSGRVFTCNVLLNKVETTEGPFLHATVRDISKEKEAAKALNQKTQELQQVLMAISKVSPVCSMSPSGNIIEGNDLFAEILGLSPRQLTSQNYRDLLLKNPTPHPVTESIQKTIESGNVWMGDLECTSAQGKSSFLKTVIAPIFNESHVVEKYIAIHFDVTEQVSSEKRLEEAQQISKIGSWEYDLIKHRLRWTSEHYRIFEISEPQSDTSLYQMYRERIHPDDLMTLDQVLDRTQKDGQDFIYDHRVSLDGGTRIKYVRGIGKVLRDQNGIPRMVTGTCQDVTSQVQAEQAVELSRLKATQSAKLASLGEMSAGIAHEINNPLAIVTGTVSLVKKIKKDDPAVQEKMVVIEKATNRISKIVNGLRKFARASDSVDLKLHSLAEIVRDATIMTEAKSKRHSTKIELSLQTEESVLCDAIEIEQVVINLINNGIDAVKQSDERWLKIALFKEHQEIVVQVIDSGKGISREIETKLFQPFFTTKPVGEGTGLGLSICKGILDHHKATLRVNHDLPNTCFEIRFRSDSPEEF